MRKTAALCILLLAAACAADPAGDETASTLEGDRADGGCTPTDEFRVCHERVLGECRDLELDPERCRAHIAELCGAPCPAEPPGECRPADEHAACTERVIAGCRDDGVDPEVCLERQRLLCGVACPTPIPPRDCPAEHAVCVERARQFCVDEGLDPERCRAFIEASCRPCDAPGDPSPVCRPEVCAAHVAAVCERRGLDDATCRELLAELCR